MKITRARGITLCVGLVALLAVSFFFSPLSSVMAEDATTIDAPAVTMDVKTSDAPAAEVIIEDKIVSKTTINETTTTTVTPDETVVIETKTVTTTDGSDTNIDVAAIMKDRVLGDANAPVTIIEYASMTCIHCSNFHNTVFPAVKQELVNSGKAKFIFREFPLDAVALKASMMARCAPEDKFYSLLEVLFANQKRWVGADDSVEAMSKLGKLAGLSDERIDACLASKELESEILRTRQTAASTYDVNATPTFVFNNGAAVKNGVLPIQEFKDTVKQLTPRK